MEWRKQTAQNIANRYARPPTENKITENKTPQQKQEYKTPQQKQEYKLHFNTRMRLSKLKETIDELNERFILLQSLFEN